MFEQNKVYLYEIFPTFIAKCLYSTERDETFHNFVQELGCDSVATIHFIEDYFALCTLNHVLLLDRNDKLAVNDVLFQIQNSTVYSVEEEDRHTLFSYWKFDLIQGFGCESKLSELRRKLDKHLAKRFTAHGVERDDNMTNSSFFYYTQHVSSTYFDLTPHERHPKDRSLPPAAAPTSQPPSNLDEILQRWARHVIEEYEEKPRSREYRADFEPIFHVKVKENRNACYDNVSLKSLKLHIYHLHLQTQFLHVQ